MPPEQQRKLRGADGSAAQMDLFDRNGGATVAAQLTGRQWPAQERFPVNRDGHHVRALVWPDLLQSTRPLIVAGYSSIAQLIDFAAQWSEQQPNGQVRVLLGTEPHPTVRRDFSSVTAGFTEEVRRYWLEDRGISLALSARVVQALDVVDAGQLVVRFAQDGPEGGRHRLHAKIYIGANAATSGSSNFTQAGLSDQIEVNTRFTEEQDPDRCGELELAAENLWSIGSDWTAEFRTLLNELLQVVTWQEALARACGDLLEGDWATRYLTDTTQHGAVLWPSQRAGIAQALWIINEVGSVLVADATGSGKTRMGAQLTRAVRDRLWATGRARQGLTALVGPPAVLDTWEREATRCGLSLTVASHGELSRSHSDGPRATELAVATAQVLAVDEAHNFLNQASQRTQRLQDNRAEHVLLFTATPINRGATDLLALINLLGADNFDPDTLQVLGALVRRRNDTGQSLTTAQLDGLNGEISRFTVRRTKTVLNGLVDQDPAAYTHPDTGRVCRYPTHVSRIYPTAETPHDTDVATRIQQVAAQLTGIGGLERVIAVPAAHRARYGDQRWLEFRLASTRGLAAHRVLDAMRSSRAALVEHLAGSAAAAARFDLDPTFKQAPTGDQFTALAATAAAGPPRLDLAGPVPEWLTDPDQWSARCAAEAARYQELLDTAAELSPAREDAKAELLADLAGRHDRILAFDQHLITLAALEQHLAGRGITAVVATGDDPASRRRVQKLFARTSTTRAVALCSNALNEGLNLQGGSALVHLDLPTTLRVVEQRVGRIERMDSPHDTIEVWWPRDGAAFATRAHEVLLRRVGESARLLGSNLPVPDLDPANVEPSVDSPVVSVERNIADTEKPDADPWDGLRDALDPVRQLVSGDQPLIGPAEYTRYRHVTSRVVARVSPVHADQPWAFLAVAGSADGAPRWQFLDGPDLQLISDLGGVCAKLRAELADGPATRPLDTAATDLLDAVLTAATSQQFTALPRRLAAALNQMGTVLTAWATAARWTEASDATSSGLLQRLIPLARPGDGDTLVDPYLVADRWLTLVRPTLDEHRRAHRKRPYVLLTEITRHLIDNPIPLPDLAEAFNGLPTLAPLAERISACILGVST